MKIRKLQILTLAAVPIVLLAAMTSQSQTVATRTMPRSARFSGIGHESHNANQSQSSNLSTSTPAPPATSYAFSYLDYPQSPYTLVWAINPGAETSKVNVTGIYGAEFENGLGLQLEGQNGTTYAFKTLGAPSGTNQEPGVPNDFGKIVGTYEGSDGNYHGYELSGGKFTALNVPFTGAASTEPGQINNSGEVAGLWIDSSGVFHGFSLSGGTYASFDYPAAIETEAYTLNNSGQIVGSYEDSAQNWHGFLFSDGSFTSIDVPGATTTIAIGVNDPGDIVGYYCTTGTCAGNSSWQGFLLSGGVFTTINVPGSIGTVLEDINNNGVVVGGYTDSRGGPTGSLAAHGFVAYPN